MLRLVRTDEETDERIAREKNVVSKADGARCKRTDEGRRGREVSVAPDSLLVGSCQFSIHLRLANNSTEINNRFSASKLDQMKRESSNRCLLDPFLRQYFKIEGASHGNTAVFMLVAAQYQRPLRQIHAVKTTCLHKVYNPGGCLI